MADRKIIMNSNFLKHLNVTKNIIETKQKESDSIFEHFISKFNITDERLKDHIFDYCYNDFETPYLKNYIKELNDSARV